MAGRGCSAETPRPRSRTGSPTGNWVDGSGSELRMVDGGRWVVDGFSFPPFLISPTPSSRPYTPPHFAFSPSPALYLVFVVYPSPPSPSYSPSSSSFHHTTLVHLIFSLTVASSPLHTLVPVLYTPVPAEHTIVVPVLSRLSPTVATLTPYKYTLVACLVAL